MDNSGEVKGESRIKYSDRDRDVAWYIYVDIVTRSITYPMKEDEIYIEGCVTAAYNIFVSCREAIKILGRKSKLNDALFNFIIGDLEPFTTKWYSDIQNKTVKAEEFPKALKEIQVILDRFSNEMLDVVNDA